MERRKKHRPISSAPAPEGMRGWIAEDVRFRFDDPPRGTAVRAVADERTSDQSFCKLYRRERQVAVAKPAIPRH